MRIKETSHITVENVYGTKKKGDFHENEGISCN
jgi:hypothetical protein